MDYRNIHLMKIFEFKTNEKWKKIFHDMAPNFDNRIFSIDQKLPQIMERIAGCGCGCTSRQYT